MCYHKSVFSWRETLHAKSDERVRAIYPDGIHGDVADSFKRGDISVKTATLDTEDTTARYKTHFSTRRRKP